MPAFMYCSPILYLSCSDIHHLLLNNRPKTCYSGTLIYQWFLSHCTQCETKHEYDRSQHRLTQFLSLEETEKTLKKRCINCIYKLQQSLLTKEFKLASYIQMDIRNCMDACTTLPVESNNNSIKHGTFGTHTNMHTSS